MNRGAMLLLLAVLAGLAGCAATDGDRRTESGTSLQEAARINTDLGIGYFHQGRLPLALERLQRAVDQDPRYARAHSALAVVYQALEETDRAEAHFRNALRLSGRDPELMNTYGVFLCREQRYREAVDMFDRAARDRLYALPEVALTNAGVCLWQQGDEAQAEHYFRAALERNARYPDALLQMASLTLQRDNLLGARAFLQRYFDAGPVTAEALWLGVQIEQASGDGRAAAEYAGRLREDFPDSIQAQEWLESRHDGR